MILNFLDNSFIFLFCFIFFSCNDTDCITKLEEYKETLRTEQKESKEERQLLFYYIEIFSEAQETIAKIRGKKEEFKILIGQDLIPTKQKQFVNELTDLVEELNGQRILLDSLGSSEIINKSLIENMQTEIDKYKVELSEMKEKVNRLEIENKEIIKEKELLTEENDSIKDRIEDERSINQELKKELYTREVQAKKELSELIRVNDELRNDNNRKRTLLISKNGLELSEVMNNTIKCDCSFKDKNILSKHPKQSYYIQDRKILISDADRFWKESDFLVIQFKSRKCRFN